MTTQAETTTPGNEDAMPRVSVVEDPAVAVSVEVAGQLPRHLPTQGGATAATDDRHLRSVQCLLGTGQEEQRWRIGDSRQQGRILSVRGAQHPSVGGCIEPTPVSESCCDVGAAADRLDNPALIREAGQRRRQIGRAGLKHRIGLSESPVQTRRGGGPYAGNSV